MENELVPDSGRRSWFGRRSTPPPGSALQPSLPPTPTKAETVALYRRIVQSTHDQGVEVMGSTVHVCGVGPMLVAADEAGEVELVPIATVVPDTHADI